MGEIYPTYYSYIVLFDLDGTLSLVGDRLKYIHQPKKDWDAFYNACDQDEVNPIVKLMYLRHLNWGDDVRIATGRTEAVREKTLNWMAKNISPIDSDKLYMRPNKDYTPDHILKPALVKDILNEIALVYEDRSSVVRAWRNLGITCFQVANEDF